jgi:hypothetical protein
MSVTDITQDEIAFIESVVPPHACRRGWQTRRLSDE